MDTPNCHLTPGLEWFWNSWAYFQDNLMLVVCDSNIPWIKDNVLNYNGGLYGRVTELFHINPLNLAQCREYYRLRGVEMTDNDILRSYMVFGGVPYYMDLVNPEKTLDQNINELFFQEGAVLSNEFKRLIDLSFSQSDIFEKLIYFIASGFKGFSRTEISHELGGIEDGLLNHYLKTLNDSGLVKEYIPFGCKDNVKYYKLSDIFCLFYLYVFQGNNRFDALLAANICSQEDEINDWSTRAFTEICLCHIDQIRHSLGISGVYCQLSLWPVPGSKSKDSQLDLLIMRRDNVVNMCEIRICDEKFTVTETYDMTIRNRMSSLNEHIPSDVLIHPVFITPWSTNRGMYTHVFVNEINLKDLF